MADERAHFLAEEQTSLSHWTMEVDGSLGGRGGRVPHDSTSAGQKALAIYLLIFWCLCRGGGEGEFIEFMCCAVM